MQDNVDYESDDNNIEDNNPDFIIPISVHVTDVNDNIPQFIGKTPYQLNISELTIVSSRMIEIAITWFRPNNWKSVFNSNYNEV